MNVKKLIAELKKMPQNLQVHTASHDHAEYESSAIPSSVELFVKAEWMPGGENYEYGPSLNEDKERLGYMPDRCVIIHG